MIFDRIIKKLNGIRTLPRELGYIILQETNENFRKQSFNNVPWQLRKNGETGRNLLVQAGTLRRSIRVENANWTQINIATDLKYAKIHNEGGKITVTAKMKKYFWARYYKTKKKFWKNLALTKKRSLNIPQRQFLGIDTNLQQKIGAHFKKTFSFFS